MFRTRMFAGQMFDGQAFNRARSVPDTSSGTWVRVPRDSEVWIRVSRAP